MLVTMVVSMIVAVVIVAMVVMVMIVTVAMVMMAMVVPMMIMMMCVVMTMSVMVGMRQCVIVTRHGLKQFLRRNFLLRRLGHLQNMVDDLVLENRRPQLHERS